MKSFGLFIIHLLGFKFYSEIEPDMHNAVIIEAPHTSMWDFVIGRAGLWACGINCRFLIKKELFFFPLGLILRALGAVPVDRGHDGRGFFTSIINRLKTDRNFSVIITPEGTRKLTRNWKKGFYFIAQQSQRPIYLAFIDYKKKECGVSCRTRLDPSGDFARDFKIIEDFYSKVSARHPEQFNLTPGVTGHTKNQE